MVGTMEQSAPWTRRSPLANASLIAASPCMPGRSFGRVTQPSKKSAAKPDGSTGYPDGMKLLVLLPFDVNTVKLDQ